MAIEPGCVPATAVDAVVVGMISRAAADLTRADHGALSLAIPHRIAYLPFDRINPDLDLRKAAEMRSWRFLVHKKQIAPGKSGSNREETFIPVAAVTVVPAQKGHELGELNEGPLVEGTERAIRHAETLEEVREGRFEAFLLMVPAVYAVALWLQDRGGYGRSDIFLPIPPSHSDFQPFKPMRETALVGILNRLAAKAVTDAETS